MSDNDRLYLEELVSIVPRNDPERRAMDIFDAAIERRRQYRGRAAGGMAIFDGSINIPDSPGDKEIEVVDTDGPTANPGMSYLQRRVGQQLYPWIDMGTHFKPRLHLKGHTNGKASSEPPRDELDDLDLEQFTDTGPNIFPAEVCYLSRAAGSFNSHESFGKIPAPPKPKPPPRLTAHWRNSLPFAIEYLRRHPHRCEWTTPTCEEAIWFAALAA